MPESVQGAGNTGTLDVNSIVRAVMKAPVKIEPDSMALQLLSRKAKADGLSPRFTANGSLLEWQNQRRFPRSCLVGSSAPGTSTSITLSDSTSLEIGAVLEYKREIMHVTANTLSTGVITVRRNIGGRVLRSIPAGAVLRIISSRVVPEHSVKGAMFSKNPTFTTQRTQIIRRGTGISRTSKQTTKYHTEDELKYQIEMNRDEIIQQVERVMLFQDCPPTSIAAGGTGNPSSSHPMRFTAGLPYFIRTNRHNARGKIGYVDLSLIQARCYQAGGNRNYVWMGGLEVQEALSRLGADLIRTEQESTVYGRKLTRFTGPTFSAVFCPNHQMEGDFWGRAMYVLDMTTIGEHELEPLTVDMDAKTPSTDGDEIDMLTEFAPIVTNEQANALIENMI